VEATLDQRRRRISELKARVTSAGNRVTSLRERADAADSERRRLEHELSSIKEELEHTSVIHTLLPPLSLVVINSYQDCLQTLIDLKTFPLTCTALILVVLES